MGHVQHLGDQRRPVIVQKYGGSSVADVAKLVRVADKVVATKRAGHDVVVVVSAMGKTTDGLLSLARQVATEAGAAAEPPRRELDMLLSTGERVSMALLSIAIQARGYDAISFTGSQSGILTNDRHFDARIIEVRPHRIEDELARGRIVIVAGYQGMSYRREITTLGRGGSDTTAVALAAALGAEACEIYSDVDGVYSADPRVVPDALHLPELDHAMLQEMAECGAKVVCAQAIEWARRAGISIFARSTFADTGRQTVVRPAGDGETISARAVVCEPSVALVSTPVCRAASEGSPSTLDALLGAAASAGLTIKDVSAAGAGVSASIPLLNVPDWASARRALTAMLPELDIVDALSAVSVVGDGLAASPEPMRRFNAVLRGANVTPRGFVMGALRLSASVPMADAAAAQRALHDAFVSGPAG